MKTIYFIFLAVFIMGSTFFTLSSYYEHYSCKRKEYVYSTLGAATLIGGFIFGIWALLMWAHHLW